MRDLAGQVAVVVDADRGVGQVLAHDLAEHGATVVSLSHKEATRRPIVHDIGLGSRYRTFAIAVDLTDRTAVHDALKSLEGEGVDAVDLLVNNVEPEHPGVVTLGSDPDQWWSIVSRHIRTTQLLIHELIPGMVDRDAGRLVSLMGNPTSRSRPARHAHGVGRAGLVRLTEILAEQLTGSRVRVFPIVSPAPADPPTFDQNLKAQGSWPDAEEVVTLVQAIARGELDQWSGLPIPAVTGKAHDLAASRPSSPVRDLRSRRSDRDL